MNPVQGEAKGKKTAIQLSNVQKKYGSFTAVDDLSFSIYRGEVFAILGPNGAGKTTTINMICGISPVTKGEIKFFNSSANSNLSNRIGTCPQSNIFWPKLTCLEQLIFMSEMYGIASKPSRKRSAELLEILGLKEKSHVLAGKLSGGMKRRLSICLALVHDPDILILDEPEAGLDPQSRILVRAFIKNLSVQKTIILTTHNMDEADRVSHRIGIMDHGKLLRLDTPGNLKKSIGTGDILELELENFKLGKMDGLIRKFSQEFQNVNLSGSSLLIKSKNLIESITAITEKVNRTGIKIKKISLRENTLEDVFIYLTGRKLRE